MQPQIQCFGLELRMGNTLASPGTNFKKIKVLVSLIQIHLTLLNLFGKKIWALDVPNKVKHFIWRACRNSRPTKCNLVHRQVLTDHHCDRCSTSQEDMLHALWSCPELDGVWDATEWNFRSWVHFQNFRELLN